MAKEEIWVDAWIRWERNSKCNNDIDNEDEDDDKLPPPTECYTFTYPNPTNEGSNIKLELKGYHDDSEQTWNSTGLTLWRSSDHLCRYLVSEHQLLQGINDLRVLEVGSGLGRCGLLAHHLSHKDSTTTVLTDGDTDTLKQLRENVRNNTKDDDDNISCKQLIWGEEHAKRFLSERQPEERNFHLILGSDLLYVNSVIRPLFETVGILLDDTKESKFLMAHCSRREGNEVELLSVLDIAGEEGFDNEVLVEEDDISVISFKRTRSKKEVHESN